MRYLTKMNAICFCTCILYWGTALAVCTKSSKLDECLHLYLVDEISDPTWGTKGFNCSAEATHTSQTISLHLSLDYGLFPFTGLTKADNYIEVKCTQDKWGFTVGLKVDVKLNPYSVHITGAEKYAPFNVPTKYPPLFCRQYMTGSTDWNPVFFITEPMLINYPKSYVPCN